MLTFLALPPGYVWLAPYLGALALVCSGLIVPLLILRHALRLRRAVPALREGD